jgi:hypothetical protein
MELLRRDADVECPAGDVGEARRLQPRLVTLPINLFFKRAEDAVPLIGYGCWDWNKGHRRYLLSILEVRLRLQAGMAELRKATDPPASRMSREAGVGLIA